MRLVLLLAAIGSSTAWAQEAAEPPSPAPAEAPPTTAEPAAQEPSPAVEPPTSPQEPTGEPAVEPAPKRAPKVRKKKVAPPAPAPAPEAVQVTPPDAGSAPSPLLPPGKSAAQPESREAQETARLFFSYLLSSDLRAALRLTAVPFQLEGRRIGSTEELFQEWLKQLREKRTDLLTLYGVELLTPTEMEKKYGKPPERLKALPYREPHAFLAVANLSGHAAIAVLRIAPDGSFRVVGYAD